MDQLHLTLRRAPAPISALLDFDQSTPPIQEQLDLLLPPLLVGTADKPVV